MIIIKEFFRDDSTDFMSHLLKKNKINGVI